jgi:GNAT superfamily N-acetyltransferase
MIRLEPVADSLPAGVKVLREEARAEGYRMLDTLVAEWESGAQRFVHPGEMLLAGYIGEQLAGIGGMTLEATVPGAMRMRRVYVARAYRRSGVGQALATALLKGAGDRTVTANAASGSEAFWESLGFVPDRSDGRTHIRR